MLQTVMLRPYKISRPVDETGAWLQKVLQDAQVSSIAQSRLTSCFTFVLAPCLAFHQINIFRNGCTFLRSLNYFVQYSSSYKNGSSGIPGILKSLVWLTSCMPDTRVAFDIGSKQQHESKQNKPLMESIKLMSRLRDPEGSGSIFHFRTTNNIAAARMDFLRNASWSMDTTSEMRPRFSSSCIGPNRGDQNGGWRGSEAGQSQRPSKSCLFPVLGHRTGIANNLEWLCYTVEHSLTDVISQYIIFLRYPGDGGTRLVVQ
ncbi:hypothetical protein MP228_005700 [Amoeboaphelidium protococcarum]|nr:hypothetical protein MP228_005700 [Amoeboaphelidium protococcarum]